MPFKAFAPTATQHKQAHRTCSRFTRSQADQATMHLYLAAQRPQIKMPACRRDYVHVAEASHVLWAWEMRGMLVPILRAWVSLA